MKKRLTTFLVWLLLRLNGWHRGTNFRDELVWVQKAYSKSGEVTRIGDTKYAIQFIDFES